MKNILFMIPDSLGIRNYLFSDVLLHINKKLNIHIWSPFKENDFDEISKNKNIEIFFKQIKLPKIPLVVRIFRDTAKYARLKIYAKKLNNKTILSNWQNSNKLKFKNKFFKIFCKSIGSILYLSYHSILFVENCSFFFWPRILIKNYENELKLLNIDKIFITHQRVLNLTPICIAAKNLNIEVITVIYSWDNLPKASLNVIANKYLVWSEFMKNEMKLYYPEINQKLVLVTGTPQFEFYKKMELLIPKKIFAQKYNLDIKKKWILYSGGDLLTSPYDQNYVSDILESLKNNDNIQLILRRSPADISNRFDYLKNLYPNHLCIIDPLWENGTSWDKNLPRYDDFKLLVSLAYFCELAINVGSSIVFDFVAFDKPTIYIDYQQSHFKNWDIKYLNSYQHFKSMPSKNSVIWLNGRNNWEKVINLVIKNPKKYAQDRFYWYSRINKSTNHFIPSLEIAKILMDQR